MADSRVDLETPQRPKRSFFRRLVLGTTTLSILGLVVMFFIVNTVVRGVIYDNVIGITQRDTTIYAREIDAWFQNSYQLVEYLTITWQTTGIEPGEGHAVDPIAASFMRKFDFFMEVYVGFEDGRFVGGSGFIPDPDWDPTTRPWYRAAMEAPGEIVTVLPFVDDFTESLIVAVSQWVPELDGRAAVVGVGIRFSAILETVERHRVMGGGYLILVGPGGEIISHPNVHYNPTPDRLHNLRDIPNGELLMEMIASGNGITHFDDFRLGPSYFVVFPLETSDWILAAIVPATVVRDPVLQYLTLVMATLAAFLIALFLFTIIFVSRITTNMEESHLAHERLRIILDNMPLVSNVRSKDFGILTCNAEAPKMFGLRDKQEYLDRFFELSPELQPDGMRSDEKAESLISQAFATGKVRFEWMHQTVDGEPIPADVTLIRVDIQGGDHILAFVRDLREHYENQEKANVMEQMLKATLDASPLACCTTDYESNVLDCNTAAVELFGLKSKQEFRERFFELSPEHQPDGTPSKTKLKNILQQTVATKSVHFEWMHQTLDGEPIPCDVTLERMVIGNKVIKVGYLRDLRDLYKYRETERIARQRLQLMLDSSPMMCAIFDDNIRIVEVNEKVVPFLGLSDKQEYLNRFFDFVPEYQPDGVFSREKTVRMWKKVIETGEERFEWMHQTSSGEPVPAEVTLKHIRISEKDFIIAYARDLRDYYKYMEVNKRMRFVFDTVPFVLAFWDKNFEIIECNQEAARRFGLSSKEEFKERFFDFSPEFQPDGSPSKEKAIEFIRQGFSRGHVEFEWMHQKPDGTQIPTEVLGFRSRYQGEETLLTCAMDLRKQNESHQRKARYR